MTAKSDVKIMTRDEIGSFVQTHLDDPHFVFFMNSFLPKWEEFSKERQAVVRCVEAVCLKWSITKDELYYDKQKFEPRGALFYLIKQHIKLSYEVIGGMFHKDKAWVIKLVKEAKFILGQGKKKEYIEKMAEIEGAVFGRSIQ